MQRLLLKYETSHETHGLADFLSRASKVSATDAFAICACTMNANALFQLSQNQPTAYKQCLHTLMKNNISSVMTGRILAANMRVNYSTAQQ